MKTVFTSAILFFLFVTVYGQDKKITKTFDGIKTINLETASGDVKVKRSAGSATKVELTHSYDEDDYKPEFEQSGGKLIISENFSSGNHSGSANWVLEIPDNTSLKMNTGSGDLSIEEVTADIRSNLGSGDITISAVNGNVDMNTGSGDVEIEKLEGDLQVNTGSGNVRIAGGSGTFSMNAGSGTITLNNLKGDFSVNTGSGDIRTSALTISGKSKFNTGSGDATVVVGAPLDHDISINSGSGNSTLNFNGNEIGGQIIMTADKKQGEIVAPFKFDKEEELKEGSSVRIQKTAKVGAKTITIRIGTGSGTAEVRK